MIYMAMKISAESIADLKKSVGEAEKLVGSALKFNKNSKASAIKRLLQQMAGFGGLLSIKSFLKWRYFLWN